MNTNYNYSKYNRAKQYDTPSPSARWKSPVALSLSVLAFMLIWKLGNLIYPFTHHSYEEEWEESNQVTLDVALPQNQEETILIQPSTMAASSIEPDWKSFTIHEGDSLAYYFQEAGLDSKSLQEVLAVRDASHLKKIYPGQTLKLQPDYQGNLQSLQFDIDPLTTLLIQRQNNGKLKGIIEQKPIEKRVAFGGGQIVDSFFVAGKNAQLDDAMIMELANVFAYDIDFAQDIQPNDHFKVLFEEYYVNGVKVGNGPIVAAEFVNNSKLYRAIRYTDQNQVSSYFTPAGEALKKAFIRTPVQFSRISSHFNLKRRHPILHHIRAHRGVDYAAPAGTPVKAAGVGKVAFVGKKSGYGNTIILQHGHKYTTLYAHLSKFAKSLKPGATIRQGQIIGYVGSTGLASGPHLHYEFRIHGVHHNPLTVALPQAEAITGKAKMQFLAYTKNLLSVMDQHDKIMVASNDY